MSRASRELWCRLSRGTPIEKLLSKLPEVAMALLSGQLGLLVLKPASRVSAETAVLSEKGEKFASEGLDRGATCTFSLGFAEGSPSLIFQAGDLLEGPIMLFKPRPGQILGAGWRTPPKASGKDIVNGSTQTGILLFCCDGLQN